MSKLEGFFFFFSYYIAYLFVSEENELMEV